MLEHGGRRRSVMRCRRGVDADRQQRHERVAGDERAVAAAARVVAAAEVGELPALRRRDEQLAGVRVRERRPARHASAVEPRRGCLQPSRRRKRSSSPSRRATASSPSRRSVDVDRRLAVEPPRELGGVDARARQEVDLAGAVRGGDDDLSLEAGEARLERAARSTVRLAVVGEEDDRVALEELVRRRRPRRAAPPIAASVRSSATPSAPSGPCACDA